MSQTPSSTVPPMQVAILPVTPLQQNCTLLWCTATMKAAVIDPGGDLDRIKALVAKAGVTVEKLLITHGHLDHCGGAAQLARDLGVPIEGPHEADLFWIAKLAEDSGRWGVPAEIFTPTRWLDQGDTVTVGNLTLDVLHCPGHTPGHVVFFHEPSRFAVVGDVLFQGGIGRWDFPLGNFDDLVASITGRLWPLGDDVMFNPGHGPRSTFGQERATNPWVGDAALA
ncbi:MBL fold metallo-hydrolase [Novosphingobium sp. B-7]|uniref:MBL fold metallo-hydrolase n=1 Tax=Novosphingobium sp. B-7 TaxID=1298855 RepID=UPI0003B31D68|nr:MBL fold metallo-hydrolase [Novosphingobium sp. B-7]